jgi:hypothetical protein
MSVPIKQSNFIIIQSTNKSGIEDKVNELLAVGYTLAGPLIITAFYPGYTYCQPLVRNVITAT